MATSSGNPFSNSSAMAQNSGYSGSTNASRMALDNLLRRELKVSDPNDSKQISEALLSRYKETPRAISIQREAEGLPFLSNPSTPVPMMKAPTSSDAEMQQAMTDVERDLQELTANPILKDVTPELEGWAIAIRSTMTEGFNSARFALDSHQRDKTFGIRRNLGDYARLSRFVGTLSSLVVNVNYRNLSQSIDEVTSVLLVLMGESLANVSFNRSRYLLQVPYSELQARRDSVINALRNFIGSTQTAYGPNDWPRGVDAYRQLYKFLDDQGQGDLRSLLVENELSRLMDSLIHRAGQGNISGLRHLGATAQLDLTRLRRLVVIGKNLGNVKAIRTAAPPLDGFLQALELFIDAFEGSGGFRLLRLARPPVLFYGLYGVSNGEASPEDRLVRLAFLRNSLAELLDCWLQCGCSSERILCQLVLDKILYDLDRAIDLYALGTTENPEPEERAVAYSYIIDVVLYEGIGVGSSPACLAEDRQNSLTTRIRNVLLEIRNLLYARIGSAPTGQLPKIANEPIRNLVEQELKIQGDMESRWVDLVQTMASACIPFGNGVSSGTVFSTIATLLQGALNRINGTTSAASASLVSIRQFRINESELFKTPTQYEESLDEAIGEEGVITVRIDTTPDSSTSSTTRP
jgi:hypothetical protein